MKRFVDIAKTIELKRAGGKTDGDLIVPLAFSSEEPVERWWGVEILDHGGDSIRLERLRSGAPLLFNHNMNDLRGTHESDSIKVGKDRVLRGDVRITSATQIGRDTIGLVETRVLTKASIGYKVHKVVETSTKRDGTKAERTIDGAEFERLIDKYEQRGAISPSDLVSFRRDLDSAAGAVERKDDDEPIYRMMDWEPIENSLVTIPADNTVGLGRTGAGQHVSDNPSGADNGALRHIRRTSMEKTPEQLAAERAAAEKEEQLKRDRADLEKREKEAKEMLARMNPVELEEGRKRAITNLAKVNSIGDNVRDAWIQQGYSLEQVSKDLLSIMEKRGASNPTPSSHLGLTTDESKQFSFARAIKAVADGNWSEAGFELECSKAIAQKMGRVVDPKAFLVPFEVMQRPIDVAATQALRMMTGKRDLTVATAGAGGFLVETQNMGFIEILRNRSVAFRMGARRLSGLTGSITIPRQSAAATAFWLANESTGITESQQTFVQLAMSPKNVGAYTEISRQLLLQSSPGAEGIVTDDLAQVVALAADLAVLEGSGAGGQPTGISATSGIGSVTGTSMAYAGILEFQTDVAGSNVMPARGGYVTTPAVAALLMQRVKFTNTGFALWEGNVWDGTMSGYPAMGTNQVTAASMVFGDWNEVVVGEWGVLEVSVNPFANFAAGIIGVRAIYSLDVGVRRPFAFSRATSIT